MLKMRRSLVASLVLSNAASAANALSNKGGIRRLLVDNIEAYRYGEVSEATTLRRLQLAGGNASTCNADGSINFDDDFDAVAFDAQYDPMCTCDEASNLDDLPAPNVTNTSSLAVLQSYVDSFNEAVGNLSGSTEYECVNGCETCFDGLCGILETNKNIAFSASPVNFTVEEIFVSGLDSAAVEQYLVFQLSFSVCMTYTKNESGKVCIGGETDSFTAVDLNATTLPCFIEYNGEKCNSCVSEIPATDALPTCVTADCTNIDPPTTIDTCAGTGYVGPFRFVQAYDEDTANGTLSLGSCDVAVPAPTPAATSGAALTPVGTSGAAPTPAANSGAAVVTGLRASLLVLLAVCLM
jgi:hypothetical protein